jgi:8-oxo-dGTP pyrophosphatase MutT (NUDIX family)
VNRVGHGGEPVKGKRASAILFTDGKAMLLLKRSEEGDHGGTWALPGGKHKDGETDIGTAMRETKEETGLDSIPGQRFDSAESPNGRQKFTVYFYHSEPFGINLSKEHTDWDWIPFDKLSQVDLHPKFKEQLPRYLKIIGRKTHSFTEWVAIRRVIS